MELKNRILNLSEDYLYNRLDDLFDQGKEDSEEYVLIDTELNKRANRAIISKRAQQQLELEQKIERERLTQEFEKITRDNGKLNTMKAMVNEFGEEFKEDYYIDPENTVRSLCDVRHIEDIRKWECEDVFQAAAKVDQLIYYRVYDKFFRDGPTVETLDRLMSRIISNNKG